MSDPSHTKGPWNFGRNGLGQMGVCRGSPGFAGFRPICIIESPQDAHVIKCSPELYEALDLICGDAELIPDPSMDGTTDTYSVPLDDIAQAKSLLAKARGEDA